MSGEDKSLMERIELPSIPQDARSKIALVEEELARVGLEQSKCFLSIFCLCFAGFSVVPTIELGSDVLRPISGNLAYGRNILVDAMRCFILY
jgi:hypothetical protein